MPPLNAAERREGSGGGSCPWCSCADGTDGQAVQGVRKSVKNAEIGIVNLTGVEFLDEDGKAGFIERPVAVHWCNGGDISHYLQMVGQ